MDFQPFSVELLCIVSDGGFEIFLKYLSGGTAYATTNASRTAPGSGTGTAPLSCLGYQVSRLANNYAK